MSVRLRLTRMGRRHRPFYRITATDSRMARDGRVLEKLGHFDPLEKDVAKQVVLNKERAEYWLSQGAIPSDTVAQILQKHGIHSKHAAKAAERRARAAAIAQKKGKLFNKAQRVAAEKKAEEAKAAAAEEAASAAGADG
ncbi:MAG: 30S ribosomal protein S16 [Planctomycetes bacterium]|nr:30S ribosomal protein S16 [Planctomycetota bacterium]